MQRRQRVELDLQQRQQGANACGQKILGAAPAPIERKTSGPEPQHVLKMLRSRAGCSQPLAQTQGSADVHPPDCGAGIAPDARYRQGPRDPTSRADSNALASVPQRSQGAERSFMSMLGSGTGALNSGGKSSADFSAVEPIVRRVAQAGAPAPVGSCRIGVQEATAATKHAGSRAASARSRAVHQRSACVGRHDERWRGRGSCWGKWSWSCDCLCCVCSPGAVLQCRNLRENPQLPLE